MSSGDLYIIYSFLIILHMFFIFGFMRVFYPVIAITLIVSLIPIYLDFKNFQGTSYLFFQEILVIFSPIILLIFYFEIKYRLNNKKWYFFDKNYKSYYEKDLGVSRTIYKILWNIQLLAIILILISTGFLNTKISIFLIFMAFFFISVSYHKYINLNWFKNEYD